MRTLGDVSIKAEKDRIASGLNLQDAPSKPLSKSYAAQKAKQGQPAIRNLYLTGALLESQKVALSSAGSVAVDFSDDHQESIAEQNDAIEPMVGISPADQIRVDAKARQLFEANLSR